MEMNQFPVRLGEVACVNICKVKSYSSYHQRSRSIDLTYIRIARGMIIGAMQLETEAPWVENLLRYVYLHRWQFVDL